MILLADEVKGIGTVVIKSLKSYFAAKIGALDGVVVRNYFGRQRQSFMQKVALTTDVLMRGASPHYAFFNND